jgi:hypothetical protein
MSFIYHIRLLPAAIVAIAFLTGMSGAEARADETGAGSSPEIKWYSSPI